MFYAHFANRQKSFSDAVTLLSQPSLPEIDTWIPPEHLDTLAQITAYGQKNTAVSSALINLTEDIQDHVICSLSQSLSRTVCLIQSTKLPDNLTDMDKLLKSIFAEGEEHRWILLFDEADALFGKRSAGQDNEGIRDNSGYLLKKLSTFNGLALFNFFDPRSVGSLASLFTYQVLHRRAVT